MLGSTKYRTPSHYGFPNSCWQYLSYVHIYGLVIYPLEEYSIFTIKNFHGNATSRDAHLAPLNL